MVKFALPNTSQTVKRLSVRVPKQMALRIDEQVRAEGYNKKERSQWIENVIVELIAMPNYSDLVVEEFITAGTTTPLPLSLSGSTITLLEQAKETVLRTTESKTDNSALIRTAIIQHLLKVSGRQLKLTTPKAP
jgi:metal-responsive CopG/Arc/MetJ family transcriptional regulator